MSKVNPIDQVRYLTIYFIKNRTRIKIGRTYLNPLCRLAVIQTSSSSRVWIMGTIDNATSDRESELHARFAHLRIRGEWFRSDPDLFDFIAANTSPWDGPAAWEARKAVAMAKMQPTLIEANRPEPDPDSRSIDDETNARKSFRPSLKIKVDAVRDLTAMGWKANRIAELLGMSIRNVKRLRAKS